MGVFGCFEVTIGFHGRERVDYMTLDTKGTREFGAVMKLKYQNLIFVVMPKIPL
jgi:hypothetical protein